jgi:hypothetical protein
VKKLVMLAVGAILLLGIVAVAAVLLVGDGGESPKESVVTPPGTVAPVQPAPVPATETATGPAPEASGYPPGPRRLQLPIGRVKVDLSEQLVPCFQRFPPHSSLPAVLTLELEAQAGGGFAVLDSVVKSWGGATAGLVACARGALRGQIVRGGTYPPGDRAVYDYALEPPPSIAPPPPPDPLPSTLPANRLQQPRRSGASR